MTGDDWVTAGSYTFEPDPKPGDAVSRKQHEVERDMVERFTAAYKGQNRLLRKVAEAVDAAYPPEEFRYFDGRRATPPGDIVRQFIVTPAEEAEKMVGDG